MAEANLHESGTPANPSSTRYTGFEEALQLIGNAGTATDALIFQGEALDCDDCDKLAVRSRGQHIAALAYLVSDQLERVENYLTGLRDQVGTGL